MNSKEMECQQILDEMVDNLFKRNSSIELIVLDKEFYDNILSESLVCITDHPINIVKRTIFGIPYDVESNLGKKYFIIEKTQNEF